MKLGHPHHRPPADAEERQSRAPVICYPIDTLPPPDLRGYRAAREHAQKQEDVLVPPRDARCMSVPAGHIFRITSVDGPQVGDLNLWNAADISEHFYAL